jgi:zinc/manganese transport system ATP-binding protein
MILCSQLSIGYTTPLTKKIDIEIQDNQWIGIIGKNGTGKSTFLKTILGMIPVLGGSIKVLGQDPGKANHSIAYIPQEREINISEYLTGYSLILHSYLGWQFKLLTSTKQVCKKIDELIELVGATKYSKQPFMSLSGGQKKIIYLVQALVSNPKLLLLDEPLADLDTHARQQFIDKLHNIQSHNKIGLMIISHDMHEISHHLNAFLHFSQTFVHYCPTIECVKEDSYVG